MKRTPLALLGAGLLALGVAACGDNGVDMGANAPQQSNTPGENVILRGDVGDFVWCDENDNGLQDDGANSGVNNVDVIIECIRDLDGTLWTMTFTTTNNPSTTLAGWYNFNSVPAGSCMAYVDEATIPADKMLSDKACGGPLEFYIGQGPSGNNNKTIDFCLVEIPPQPGEIGDFVWCDLNDDGVQDPGEPGVPGVVVDLNCADGSSASTVTDANGLYLFTNVAPGVLCTVSLDLSSIPSDKEPGTECPTSRNVTLEPGESNLDQDFCLVELPPDPGAIGDFVWCDLNNDGIQDPGEPGVPGIVVDLSCADGSSASTVTDANGYYLFTNVTPGVLCTVSLDLSSLPADKQPGDECPTSSQVTVEEGETNLEQDFCLVEIPPDGEGCTPGYWKNHPNSWVGYSQVMSVQSVFSSASSYGDLGTASLRQALAFGGGPGVNGAARILLRAAVASLLNAANNGVNFPWTEGDVITAVNDALDSNDRATILALATTLDNDNNLGCPLN